MYKIMVIAYFKKGKSHTLV